MQLAAATRQMAASLSKQPNYTCLQTIERSERRAKRQRFQLIDVLRFEVALVEGKELYAWPGSSRFEEKDLTELVPEGGAIGTGAYASHAQSIFRGRAANFRLGGQETLDGRPAVRYDYDVPQMMSGYQMRVAKSPYHIVGYHGSFWVDPETLDVRRVLVVVDEIPPQLPIERSESTIDYARWRIGEAHYLLPTQATLQMTGIDGTVNRNEMRFSNCRQYAGESVLSFGDAPESAPLAAPAAVVAVELPAGLLVDVDLDEPLRSDERKTGDIVKAHVATAVKHKGAVLIPKGAAAEARIVRLQRNGDRWEVDLLIAELNWTGHRAAWRAIPDPPSAANTRFSLPANAIQRTLPSPAMGRPDRPGLGTMYMSGNRLVLPKGHRTTWLTLPAAGMPKQKEGKP